MQFKSKSIPEILDGFRTTTGKQVVPDQSLSLEEILKRFTRGEPLAVGRDVNYYEGEHDLEKVKNMDLVDREEFVSNLKKTQKDYENQQRKRYESLRKAAVDKIEQEEREKRGNEKGAPPEPAK